MKGHLSCCQTAPEAMTAVAGSESHDRKYRIEPVLIELSGTHASQISGCAHCLHLHTADALRQGRERGNPRANSDGWSRRKCPACAAMPAP